MSEDKLRSYPKVYNLGHAAVAKLFDGATHIEEKIDGSQFSACLAPGGELVFRSKGAVVVPGAAQMFQKAVEAFERVRDRMVPGWVYRGEFLQKPKHNTLAYDRVPANNVIIFDIDTGLEEYMGYEEKAEQAELIGLECVPCLGVWEPNTASQERLMALLETPSVLGGQKVEGFVIKAYGAFGRDGKTLMAKHVSEAFKEIHRKDWKDRNPGGKDVVQLIGEELRTPARWDKAIQHLREAGQITDTPKDIGPLMKEVQRDVREECAEEVKAKLFKWAWGNISRKLCAGLPEWYKNKLIEKQFEEER